MDETVRSHLFEPFFTTKEVGKGTGLGLAVVYGIVKQHNGWIEVYSRPGQGARFDLYLPVQQVVAPELLEVKPAPARAAGGSETILLAEDEEPVRALVCAALENLGYTVLACANGQEAVDTFAADAERIDLLILDAVMPKLSGQAAYEAISALRPDVPVLFISGYSEELGSSAFALKPDLHLLYKPFAVAELGRKVREVLDRGLAKRAY
jgi:CheY-like chemotaxis protein